MPRIIYFDDFKNTVPEKIYIAKEKDNQNSCEWTNILNRFFYCAEQCNIDSLQNQNSNKRESIITAVTNYLNTQLSAFWKNFSLD